ncbi:MAG: TonB-dependent receptor [Agriterribacter sp.]
MKKFILLCCTTAILFTVMAQPQLKGSILLSVVSVQKSPLPNATIELLRLPDSVIVQSRISGNDGKVLLQDILQGDYVCRISMAGYANFISEKMAVAAASVNEKTVVLSYTAKTLKEVKLTARNSPIQQLPDKTVINIEAGITNSGATVLEVLEKSPGITVDRSGNISMKGKQGVLVMMDGKPLYISGAELITLLENMNASQAELIELMDNPPAKYDAAGNAGIINIKTKKNRQRGFNGSANLSYGQGRYYKSNNSVSLNYRNNKFNYFFNYNIVANKNFMDLYALRTYYKPGETTVESVLQQPTVMTAKGNNNILRIGADYVLSNKTTIGVMASGFALSRKSPGDATAQWLNTNGGTDSVILTHSDNNVQWKNGGINANLRHVFSETSELSADLDYIDYDISNTQVFKNDLNAPGGYSEASKGDLDAGISIYAAKADYAKSFSNNLKVETGWKSSYIKTDNLAEYYFKQSANWQPDYGKTNHFLYNENIHALYTEAEKQSGKITAKLGLRYEFTGYKARQAGNSIVKDSSFSRNYGGLFPSAFISWQADSASLFTISAGRRIERPAFQKLNPFVFVINKYTYQRGNPFYKPQYTWNTGISHSYKNMLTTGLDYSIVKDYFSQIFLKDSTGSFVYTEGNVGKMKSLSLTVSFQSSVFSWWFISADATVTYKRMRSELWRTFNVSFTQMNTNITNQFRLGRGWSAELSGMYTTKSQQDLQEVLDPTGQVSIGLAKQVLKNKATVKLTARDIFYTQAMAGLTAFYNAQEYFKITRDSRVFTLSFIYRFGKQFKSLPQRSGGAGDEMNRVGSS